MKKLITATIVMLLSIASYAQLAEDALRFSQSFYQGTARSMGAGGAFGAVGADFSTASTNPAGLGLFRSYDMTITPEVFSRKTESTYNGSYKEDARTVFDLSNLGYVMTTPLNSSGWKFFQFAVGMNRLNNYNANIHMQGYNTTNSKLDVYWEQADFVPYDQLIDEDPFYLEPAWAVYLLDTVPGFIDLYDYPLANNNEILQTQQVFSRGSTNEWVFSFASNYNDVLFLGATIGLPYIRYNRETFYQEEFSSDNVPAFQRWSVTEYLTTNGWGINLKLGAIVKPNDWIRFGAAFHTPSYYWNMQDVWNTVTTATYGGETYEAQSVVTGNYNYRFYTPLKAIGNLAVFFNPYGFISAEYEYADYSQARFKSQNSGSLDVNDDIRDAYQSTHNLRFGTEWRIGYISLRGGYGFTTSPYANNLNDGKRTSISGGIGYKKGEFALDLAYIHTTTNEDYYLYSYNDITTNPIANKYTTSQYAATIRFNF